MKPFLEGTQVKREVKSGKRIKYYKKPKPLSTTSFEPLSTTTKGGYTTNV